MRAPRRAPSYGGRTGNKADDGLSVPVRTLQAVWPGWHLPRTVWRGHCLFFRNILSERERDSAHSSTQEFKELLRAETPSTIVLKKLCTCFATSPWPPFSRHSARGVLRPFVSPSLSLDLELPPADADRMNGQNQTIFGYCCSGASFHPAARMLYFQF